MELFGTNRKNTLMEIERLRKESMYAQAKSANYFRQILSVSDAKNNPELAKKLSRHERAIEPILKSVKSLSEEEKKEKRNRFVALLKEWNETRQDSTIREIQKLVPGYKITPSDLEYLGSFVSHHYELERFITTFQKTVSDSYGQPMDGSRFGVTIGENSLIQHSIEQYNISLQQIEKLKEALATKEALLKKPQEAISAIDFIVNFIQSRADFGGALGDGFRKEIYNGLSIYGDLVHIKINGKPLNVQHELGIYKADQKKSMIISPEDAIEISGPMMVDGEKQTTHPDPSRQKAMNIRTRFFFEFFLSETYLPSELLTPGKTSSYAHHEFPGYAGKLKIKGVYGLRMKYDPQ